MGDKMKTTLNTTMRKRKKIKVGGKGKNIMLAAEWVDDELIKNIKLRTYYSREWKIARKNKSPPEVIEQCKRRYLKQHITSIMSGDKKSQWEEKKNEETWNNGKKFWTMIKELLGKNKEIVDDAYVYTEEGLKKEIMDYETEYIEGWRNSIYQKFEKTDFSWYGKEGEKGLKKVMEEQLNQGNSGIMDTPTISEKEFVKVINCMKNGKASGVDDIPAELMKHLIKNGKIRSYLLKCFNKALSEEIHEDWLLSKTAMIPKNRKPKIMEHRPIAVTVNSGKIICSILRQKIEEFLEENNIKYENQYGFTSGGRVEHCFFILDYVTNMTYENTRKISLYFAFMDFKKAYDSINRRRLIEVLIKFKVNPQVINLIVQMYEGDRTIIQLARIKKCRGDRR